MAEARKRLDWEAQYECAMFPQAARAKRDQRPPEEVIEVFIISILSNPKINIIIYDYDFIYN